MDENKMSERAQPLRLNDTETGKEYTLEYNRDAVRFAERQGLDISELASKPVTNIPVLFFAAFRKNHPEVTRAESDRMLYEELYGLTGEELNRLSALYTQAVDVLRLTEGANPRRRLTLM